MDANADSDGFDAAAPTAIATTNAMNEVAYPYNDNNNDKGTEAREAAAISTAPENTAAVDAASIATANDITQRERILVSLK